MKKQDLAKVKDQSKPELQTLVDQLTKELVELRMQFSLGKLKDVTAMSRKKNAIAQVKTILRERELETQSSGKVTE